MTRVVHVSEPYDVYVGRAVPRKGLRRSKWANPYKIGRRQLTVVQALTYYQLLMSRESEMIRRELRGKTLGCWCAPKGGLTAADKPWICHGQVLAAIADEEE